METTTYIALQNITLTGSASSVTFSNIPNTYRDLIIAANIDNSVNTELFIRFNNDTGTNYTSVRMQGSGVAAGANTHLGPAMRLVGNGDIMTDFSHVAIVQLFDYSVANKHKAVLSRTNSSNGMDACAGRWTVSDPISVVTLIPNSGSFQVGSTFSMYGIEA